MADTEDNDSASQARSSGKEPCEESKAPGLEQHQRVPGSSQLNVLHKGCCDMESKAALPESPLALK